MNQSQWVGRCTVETTAPLGIGSGNADLLRDAPYTVGRGGLPYLPGTSLAGVLAAALRLRWPDDGEGRKKREAIFGRIGDGDGDRAFASPLRVSCGHVHDSNDLPVTLDAGPGDDEVLRACANGLTRDHVRINGRGTPDGRGKFDDSGVPAGARFTFELRLDGGDPEAVDSLRAALNGMRLGGKSRRGFGTTRVVMLRERRYDLKNPQHMEAFLSLPVDLAQLADLGKLGLASGPLPAAASEGVLQVRLDLQPQDWWLVGGGQAVANVAAHTDGEGKARHRLPLSEHAIVWQSVGGRTKGKLQERPAPVVPGSSLKGVLRHRTLFHWRRLTASRNVAAPARTTGDPLGWLFGEIKDSRSHGGRPGRVFIDDVRLADDAWAAGRTGALEHVSLDRYTGGPLEGHLFSEAPLWRGTLAVHLAIENPHGLGDPEPPAERALQLRALAFALADLCDGRLAIGAGANAGHGFATCPKKALTELVKKAAEVANDAAR